METTNTIKGIEVIAYKIMKSDITCRDFTYEVGKTYKTDKVELCEYEFHACLNPKDVLKYYSEKTKSRYFKVKLSGEITKCGKYYTQVAATEITILEEITDTFNEVIKTEWWKSENVLDLLYFSDGFAKVQRGDDKWNLIDKDGKYLSDEWFELVDYFNNGFAVVHISSGKYNFIDKNGNYLSDEWFDWAGKFFDGFAVVRREDNLYNLIGTNGNYLFDKWFMYVGNFYDGLALVQRANGEWNLIDKDGKLLSNEWYKWVDDFKEGFAEVQKANGEWNFIDKQGNYLFNEWFYYLEDFNEGLAKVRRSDGLYNFIDTKRRILSNQWFSYAYSFNDDFAKVQRTNGEWAKIDKTGTLIKFKDMEEKIKQVEDIDTLKELNKNLISENERLTKKNMKLSEKYQSTHKKNASLKTAIASIKGFENAEQLCAELNRLKQQNKSLSEANAKLIADAKVYLKTIDEQKEVISVSEKSIGTINDKLKIITLSQQSMHQALKDSGEEKSELIKKYKEALSAKCIAETKRDELEKEKNSIETEKENIKDVYRKLLSDWLNLTNRVYKANLKTRIKYLFTKDI